MNPPYSQPGPWVEKFFRDYEKRTIQEGIALLPSSTDTLWFSRVWDKASAICFVRGRIKFLDILDGYKEKYPSAKGSAIIYCGAWTKRFHDCFAETGEVIVRPHDISPFLT
ncbi:hypothetical protein CYANOKiyG1_27580 [Okeania sp. KiyG1]|nr:hypothetical protein CYANOKiyG1_27580 [Okeania sp. KiyG1]